MPKKKTNSVIENVNNNGQNKLEQAYRETHKSDATTSNSKAEKDIETRASELSARIIRELYRHYGAKDSHTNKHLYWQVMFEVARLSRKPLEEVMNNWPKFDIFSILEDIKKIVREELENEPSITYLMLTNSRLISDKMLAKVIAKSLT
jgi:hypothetical protein